MKGNDYNGDNDPSEQVQEQEKHDGDVDDDVGVVIRMVRGDGHGEEQDLEKDRSCCPHIISLIFVPFQIESIWKGTNMREMI